jgi:hypothetical protein
VGRPAEGSSGMHAWASSRGIRVGRAVGYQRLMSSHTCEGDIGSDFGCTRSAGERVVVEGPEDEERGRVLLLVPFVRSRDLAS